jgi:hypothetical protein
MGQPLELQRFDVAPSPQERYTQPRLSATRWLRRIFGNYHVHFKGFAVSSIKAELSTCHMFQISRREFRDADVRYGL